MKVIYRIILSIAVLGIFAGWKDAPVNASFSMPLRSADAQTYQVQPIGGKGFSEPTKKETIGSFSFLHPESWKLETSEDALLYIPEKQEDSRMIYCSAIQDKTSEAEELLDQAQKEIEQEFDLKHSSMNLYQYDQSRYGILNGSTRKAGIDLHVQSYLIPVEQEGIFLETVLYSDQDSLIDEEALAASVSVQSGEIFHTLPDDDIHPLDLKSVVAAMDIPAYEEGEEPYAEVHDNKPFFRKTELTEEEFRHFSELDSLGRCGTAYINVSRYSMPQDSRSSIEEVKPSGWNQAEYPGVVDDDYLYNRCHLIGFALSGENANPLNLITGTRFLNMHGMLPQEAEIQYYVKQTGNHVLYRVTPYFKGNNLVADGVLMEAESVEDNGKGICFCIYAYNVQPYVEINYKDGSSRLSTEGRAMLQTADPAQTPVSAVSISEENTSMYQIYPKIRVNWNHHVGSDWSVEDTKVVVNGSEASAAVSLSEGDQVSIDAMAVENDQSPDSSPCSASFTYHSPGFGKGFQIVSDETIVTENKGRYKGSQASISCVFNFAPEE